MFAHQTRPAYRVFSINAAGRVSGVPYIIEAADDTLAVQEAAKLVKDRTVEIWMGIRLVATLNGRSGC